MNLQELTTEELLAEITRREKEKIESDQHLFMGLIDMDGAESLMPVKTKEVFASLHNSLSLRARFNSQRFAIIYVVHLTTPMYDTFNERLLKGDYQQVAEDLQLLSTFKKISL